MGYHNEKCAIGTVQEDLEAKRACLLASLKKQIAEYSKEAEKEKSDSVANVVKLNRIWTLFEDQRHFLSRCIMIGIRSYDLLTKWLTVFQKSSYGYKCFKKGITIEHRGSTVKIILIRNTKWESISWLMISNFGESF